MIRAAIFAGTLFLSSMSYASFEPPVCALEGTECDFYCDSALRLDCPKDNYLVHFGFRYCRSFLKTEHKYSEHGQEVLKNIRACLITSLAQKNVGCDNAEDVGFASHVGCYIENGFCSLGFSDRSRILWTVRQQIANPKFQRVSAKILNACASL